MTSLARADTLRQVAEANGWTTRTRTTTETFVLPNRSPTTRR